MSVVFSLHSISVSLFLASVSSSPLSFRFVINKTSQDQPTASTRQTQARECHRTNLQQVLARPKQESVTGPTYSKYSPDPSKRVSQDQPTASTRQTQARECHRTNLQQVLARPKQESVTGPTYSKYSPDPSKRNSSIPLPTHKNKPKQNKAQKPFFLFTQTNSLVFDDHHACANVADDAGDEDDGVDDGNGYHDGQRLTGRSDIYRFEAPV